MNREELMSLLSQLVYLNPPDVGDGDKGEYNNVVEMAQNYLTYPEKLYQQNNGTETVL